MGEKGVESCGTKSIPVVVQSEGVFNVGIILTESNYDIWSQLMEIHIAERKKLIHSWQNKATCRNRRWLKIKK